MSGNESENLTQWLKMFSPHRRIQFFLGLALLCLLLLFVGGPTSEAPRSYRYGWDLGHLLCFGIWTYLYLQWRPRQSFWRQLLSVVVFAFLVGGATELLQMRLGREASWADLAKDLLGSVAALAFWAPSRHELRKWHRLAVQSGVAMLLFWSIMPLGRVIVDELTARQQFPLLCGFETPLESARWSGNSRRRIDRSIVFSGGASLQVKLNTDRYSGAFQYHSLGDWSDYRRLQLQVHNPDKEPLLIHLRIHDQEHRRHHNAYRDRYKTSFRLQQGWNRLEVPLAKVASAPKGRRMEMRRIAGVGIFVAQLESPRTIYIDEVQLLR